MLDARGEAEVEMPAWFEGSFRGPMPRILAMADVLRLGARVVASPHRVMWLRRCL